MPLITYSALLEGYDENAKEVTVISLTGENNKSDAQAVKIATDSKGYGDKKLCFERSTPLQSNNINSKDRKVNNTNDVRSQLENTVQVMYNLSYEVKERI